MNYQTASEYTLCPPPLRPLALPWTLPYAVARRLVAVSETDANDEASLKAVEGVMEVVRPRLRTAVDQAVASVGGRGTGTGTGTGVGVGAGAGAGGLPSPTQLMQSLTRPDALAQLPAVITLSQRFSGILLQRAADRLDSAASKIRRESRSRSEAVLDEVFEGGRPGLLRTVDEGKRGMRDEVRIGS